MMIHSTAPGDTLRIDIDVDEGGAGKRWLIEKASKVRIEIRKKNAALVVNGFGKNIVEWMKDSGALTVVGEKERIIVIDT